MGIKAVSIVGFDCKADEMKQAITAHAADQDMKDDLAGWGGQGDNLPFIVVLCTERLALALQQQGRDGFLKACAIFIQDYSDPRPKPPHLSL